MNSKILFIVSISLLMLISCGKKYTLDREMINHSADWPYYRGDLSAQGSIKQADFGGKLDIVWEFKSNDKPVGPLTLYNGMLVYPGSRNRIKFISADSGKYKGYIKPRGVAQTGLVISDSLGYFATAPEKSKLRCVNMLNRKTLWKKDVKDAVGGSIIIEEKIILSSAEGKLIAFDKITGERLWTFKSKERFTTPPLFDGYAIWQVSEEGTLFAVTPKDGKEIFQVRLENPVAASIAYQKSIFVNDITGIVYKIDAQDGRIMWQTETGGSSWGAIAVSESSLILGQSSGEIVSLSVDEGKIIWRYDAIDVVAASVLMVNKYVVFGTKAGDFYLLNLSDGSFIQKRELRGAISTAPVSNGQYVFVATDKGMITCFGVRNNEQEQTKTNH